jgi:pre-mRNA-processing factor 40
MLRSHPEIKHYTRWKTARPIIERETIFRSTNDDTERRQLFEEYIIELKKINTERNAVARKSAMDELVAILDALDLEPYTRWAEAHSRIQSNERFTNDTKFQTLSKSDILTAFENHIKSLERTFNDERQREKSFKMRKERKNRDQFIALLQEHKKAGKIKAGTKWMDIFPEIEADDRYTAMLGQAGSTPLDLFWDVIEDEERALRLTRNDVYDVLEDQRYEITPKTTFLDFQGVMASDPRTASIPTETLNLLFTRLLDKVTRRTEDDKHASERKQRRLLDALRSKIKHLNPSVHAASTWESIRPQISHFDEYKALETDDLRRQAFDKVIRRLKDKDVDEPERERDRRNGGAEAGKRDHRDRDRGHAERRPRGGTRSPEPDAYEADRRKAMADRERQYRKASATGLSPPPSAAGRERGEKDRHERISSRHGEGRLGYERERREREEERERERERERDRDRERYRERERERERMHRRGERGEGKGRERDELDYGGAGRRRRGDSDGESVGSRKRVRRDGGRERERSMGGKKRRTVTPPVAKEVVKEVHSGSEEGEMVEE